MIPKVHICDISLASHQFNDDQKIVDVGASIDVEAGGGHPIFHPLYEIGLTWIDLKRILILEMNGIPCTFSWYIRNDDRKIPHPNTIKYFFESSPELKAKFNHIQELTTVENNRLPSHDECMKLFLETFTKIDRMLLENHAIEDRVVLTDTAGFDIAYINANIPKPILENDVINMDQIFLNKEDFNKRIYQGVVCVDNFIQGIANCPKQSWELMEKVCQVFHIPKPKWPYVEDHHANHDSAVIGLNYAFVRAIAENRLIYNSVDNCFYVSKKPILGECNSIQCDCYPMTIPCEI